MVKKIWYDLYKLWTYATAKDPQSHKRDQDFGGAGVTQPDAVPDIRADGSFWGGGKGMIRLRDSNDFIDLSTVTNRQSRYREYERLQNMAEIEFAMNVFADESCVAGGTMISTPFFGDVTIEWLAENKADEKFGVYCWDFEKDDFTIGWGYDPRVVKEAPTVKVIFDNGTSEIMTDDHRILLEDNAWSRAGKLKFGDEVKAFYRVPARQSLSGQKHSQFPRIRTKDKGWIHERQFIDEWRSGKVDEKLAKTNEIASMIAGGLSTNKIAKLTGHQWIVINNWLRKAGFSVKEMKWLGKKPQTRRVIDVRPHGTMNVYDLSVEGHANFCTNSIVCHNCQRGENDHPFDISVGDKEVEEELKFLFWHKKMLNLDQKKMWGWYKNLFVMGDFFLEVIIDPENPSDGIMNVMPLPADSVYRIETTKGRLIEFQQSKEGPDYQSLARVEVTKATRSDLQQATAVRFAPDQVIHIRIGDDRKTYYPYGISLIESARGPAHQLRLMEDAMVVYRLIRAPERRVFYIDVQQLPPFKAEAFIDRMKDQFKKKKVATNKGGGGTGASAIEERWHSQPADEDFWIPIRPNSNTRVETLPGAQNLGEIDDAIYFRNKLFTALQFPKNYINQEDPGQTRITLSAQDVKFARLIERLQAYMEDGLWEIADRHLKLRGFPTERYEDLKVKMTPPSEWRELSRAEVVTNRINNSGSLKGSQLLSDFDVLVDWMKLSEKEAKEKIARNKIQKLEDLKLQVMAQNPILLGVGTPGEGDKGGQEMGTEAGGQQPMPGGDGQQPPEGQPPEGGPPQEGGQPPQGGEQQPQGDGKEPSAGGPPLESPSSEDVKKFDLGIEDFASGKDEEDVDYSEED